MHLAAAQHSPRGISLLLANGASVNARDHGGRTPLHAACANCHDNGSRGDGDGDLALLEGIELLLSSGALADARDAKGQTALHLSALAGNLSAARALLAGGATIVADDAGNSPLHLAAAMGHSDIMQLLVVADRDEPPPRKPPASTCSEAETREHCRSRPRAAVGDLQSVFGDEGLSAHERGLGGISVGLQKSRTASTTTNGEALGDIHVAARMATAPGQHFGGTGELTEEKISLSSRESGGSSLAVGPTASVGNGYSWGGPATPYPVPNDQTHPLEPQTVLEYASPHWQWGGDAYRGSVENSIRNADRINEDDAVGRPGRRAVEGEYRRRRPKGGRLRLTSRRRQESARDDHDHDHDRTLGWPEALPPNEYKQVNGLNRERGWCIRETFEPLSSWLNELSGVHENGLDYRVRERYHAAERIPSEVVVGPSVVFAGSVNDLPSSIDAFKAVENTASSTFSCSSINATVLLFSCCLTAYKTVPNSSNAGVKPWRGHMFRR